MKDLSVAYHKNGSDINAALKGRLVSLAALELRKELHHKVDPWDRLILDLSKVTNVDTTGVNALLHTQLRCVHKNASMIIKCPADHPLKELLKLTHAEQYMEVVLP